VFPAACRVFAETGADRVAAATGWTGFKSAVVFFAT
jgi:hypothetical protein